MPERILALVLVATFFAVDAAAQGSSADAQKCAKLAPAAPVAPPYPVDPPPGELPSDSGELYRLAAATESCGYVKDSIRIYRRAARAGSGQAAKRLGEIFNHGAPGVPRDYAESMLWYETARKLGEQVEVARPPAVPSNSMGLPPPPKPDLPSESEALYQQALAMERDGNAKDAVRMYLRAARVGHGKAARRLGRILDCGAPGVPRDYAESLRWYDTARKLGETVPTPSSNRNC